MNRMFNWRTTLMVGPLLGCLTLYAQEPAKKSRLPIDVPKDASIDLDADAPAKQFVPMIKQLMVTGDKDPDKITVKTKLGSIDLSTKEVVRLLEPIKELHIISYSVTGESPTLKHYEDAFHTEGLHKVASHEGLLVMKRGGADGLYALVMRKKNKVTIVRTDGIPDAGTVGHFVLVTLGQTAQHIFNGKKH